MFNPVYSCNKNPKIHAKIMALKKDGKLIPNVLITLIILSTGLSLNNAEITPNDNPKINAIVIEETAKTMVFGNVSFKISDTFFPCFAKDLLK